MTESLRLMAIMAHPDDESLGIGGVLARYSAEGIETHVLTATPGDKGRYFDNDNRPADEEVGRVRAEELRAACAQLGVHDVQLLGYRDKELDAANHKEVIARIDAHLQRVKPHVVITFGMDGAYGHPDHIAICQFATAAVMASSHRVSKLYYFGWPAALWELYQKAFKKLTSTVDGVERRVNPWPDWMLTTKVDARKYWPSVWRAVQQHRTQLAIYGKLNELTDEQHAVLWGDQYFYRLFSLVNGGRARETDLFEGLR